MKLLNSLYANAYISAKKIRNDVKAFLDNQSGVGNVVATIIILLIAVLLIAVFWNRLKEFVSGIMDQIFGTEFSDSGLGG